MPNFRFRSENWWAISKIKTGYEVCFRNYCHSLSALEYGTGISGLFPRWG
jgi:hypothetical protein